MARLKKIPGKAIFRICGASYLHLLPHQESSFPLSTTFATTQSCIEGDHSGWSLVQRHHLKNANGKVPPSNMNFALTQRFKSNSSSVVYDDLNDLSFDKLHPPWHATACQHLVDFSQALMAALKQYSSRTRSSMVAKSQREASHLMACHYFKLTIFERQQAARSPSPLCLLLMWQYK